MNEPSEITSPCGVPQTDTFTSLADVITSAEHGYTVCWKSTSYVVEWWAASQTWNVVCTFNRSATGLFWRDGVTSDYRPADFFIAR